MEKRVILGIDPGSNVMGYGIIEALGTKPVFIDMGIKSFSSKDEHFDKMKEIFFFTIDLINKFNPNELSIEAPFYGNNIQSMLKLGRAQGVAISAALSRNIPIFEYAPRKIKMSITGKGNAAKEEVAFILQRMLGMSQLPEKLDATDGLAAAVCHFFQNKQVAGANSAKSWKEFIAKNPNRIKK